jgi:hypothetical protein|tara:strand:- start:2852 stop:3631 length:780 start_codon:yes stop_codon:yes gene_type:complete
MAYARGKHAYFISDRSGMRFPYSERIKEWTGLVVHRSEFEEKHPQLEPSNNVSDATALRQPRPDTARIENEKISLPIFDLVTLSFQNNAPKAQTQLGTVTIGGDVVSVIPNLTVVTGVTGTGSINNVTVTGTGTGIAATYTVTVVGGNPVNHPYYNVGSANKFAIDGSTATADVLLNLSEGSTYRFDQSDSSNSGHPLRFSTTANGTHGGGSEYTTGVTTNGTPGSAGAYTQITVASGAPTLYYYCTNHSGMGWQANTP